MRSRNAEREEAQRGEWLVGVNKREDPCSAGKVATKVKNQPCSLSLPPSLPLLSPHFCPFQLAGPTTPENYPSDEENQSPPFSPFSLLPPPPPPSPVCSPLRLVHKRRERSVGRSVNERDLKGETGVEPRSTFIALSGRALLFGARERTSRQPTRGSGRRLAPVKLCSD